MNLELEGRTFVVGGGSRGLGRATAEALVAEGARVVLVARDADTISAVAGELGDQAEGLAADLGTRDGVDLVAERISQLDRLDGMLVNGGGPPTGSALSLDDDSWLTAFMMTIGGPLRLLRAAAGSLTADSSVLFVTSSSVRQRIPGLDTSNVLRPGVAALVKCLSVELAPVRVNAIAPGRFDTARVQSLDTRRAEAAGVSLEELRSETSAAIPVGRYGDPAEFGRVASFLLSPGASYVSGASIQVDGGLVTSVP